MSEEISRSNGSQWRIVADKIVAQCMRIERGEVVQLGGGVHNFDLLGALAAAVRRAGAYPELNVTSDDLQLDTLLTVPEEYLRQVPPHRLRWLDDIDAMIVTDAVADPSRAEAVPRERRIAAHAAAEVVERHIFERGMRWAYVGYPTPASTAGLPTSFDELWAMFWRAVDCDYELLATEGAGLAQLLETGARLRIVTDKGTDLTLDINGRPVLVDDGVISAADVEEGNAAINLPAGKVVVAPHERSATGRVVFDWAWRDGHVLEDVDLHVADGRVEFVGARTGGDVFKRTLDVARGDKDRLGKFALGLNASVDRFTGYGLIDEKRRGAVHLSLGDNRLFGGANVSTLHFDLFLEKPTVFVDERCIVEAGNLRT